jgi:hypothetical protein
MSCKICAVQSPILPSLPASVVEVESATLIPRLEQSDPRVPSKFKVNQENKHH